MQPGRKLILRNIEGVENKSIDINQPISSQVKRYGTSQRVGQAQHSNLKNTAKPLQNAWGRKRAILAQYTLSLIAPLATNIGPSRVSLARSPVAKIITDLRRSKDSGELLLAALVAAAKGAVLLGRIPALLHLNPGSRSLLRRELFALPLLQGHRVEAARRGVGWADSIKGCG